MLALFHLGEGIGYVNSVGCAAVSWRGHPRLVTQIALKAVPSPSTIAPEWLTEIILSKEARMLLRRLLHRVSFGHSSPLYMQARIATCTRMLSDLPMNIHRQSPKGELA